MPAPPWGSTRQSVGAYGEDLAVRYLAGLGWQILERNWRCALGEIDVVARDGEAVVVCEVKTRRTRGVGDPVEAVTRLKHRRLRQLAAAWAREHPENSRSLRIDIVGVFLADADTAEVRHLRGVSP